MKINKKQIEMLSSLPDEALRKVIVSLGNASGFDFSGMKISSEDLNRLRSVMLKMDDADIAGAAEIIKNIKNGKRKE